MEPCDGDRPRAPRALPSDRRHPRPMHVFIRRARRHAAPQRRPRLRLWHARVVDAAVRGARAHPPGQPRGGRAREEHVHLRRLHGLRHERLPRAAAGHLQVGAGERRGRGPGQPVLPRGRHAPGGAVRVRRLRRHQPAERPARVPLRGGPHLVRHPRGHAGGGPEGVRGPGGALGRDLHRGGPAGARAQDHVPALRVLQGHVHGRHEGVARARDRAARRAPAHLPGAAGVPVHRRRAGGPGRGHGAAAGRGPVRGGPAEEDLREQDAGQHHRGQRGLGLPRRRPAQRAQPAREVPHVHPLELRRGHQDGLLRGDGPHEHRAGL
mmetsp:Transcript_11959/g.16592  ORF Transcript_11959/g.16592 Transcript_11959/m.16592 type:complete len:323 (+) Transcript_11959:465-1433(+)